MTDIKPPKILGLGNALVDILVRMPSDDPLKTFELRKGSMQLVGEEQAQELFQAVAQWHPQSVCGGSAANTICGLSNLGIATAFQGKIGDGDLGQTYSNDLQHNGVEPRLLVSPGRRTGCSISLISPDTERTMVTCLGAAAEMTPDELDPDSLGEFTHFYSEGYLVQTPELLEKAYSTAQAAGLVTMLDLASYNVVEEHREFLRRLIRRHVDVLFANEEEAAAFTGKEERDALDELGELCDTVALKLGVRGSLVRMNGETVRMGVIRSNAIDTTGAGDLYAAGFIYGLVNQLTPTQCAQVAAITSGNVIEVIGTRMDARRWTAIRQEIKVSR